jgi:hypothetical protein
MAIWRWRGTGRAGDLNGRRAFPTPLCHERLDGQGRDPLSLVADGPCLKPARNEGFSMDGPVRSGPGRRNNFERSETR